MIFLAVLLVLVAMALGLEGFTSLTQATLGVGTLAGACLLAIFARLAQASAHHQAALDAIRATGASVPETVPAPAEKLSTMQCAECRTVAPIGPEYCANCGHRHQADLAAGIS